MAVVHGQQMVLSLTVIVGALFISALAQDTESCRPPSISADGRRKYYFISNSGFQEQIPCIADGDGTLQYQWTKNGQPLEMDPSGTGLFMQAGVGTLVFESPQPSDRGYYQCHVSNNCGVSLSDKSLVIGAFIEPFPTLESPRVVRAPVGGSVVLRCIPPYSVPSAIVQWLVHNDVDAYEEYFWDRTYEYTPVQLDDRVTMSYTGDLYITNVHSEDEQGGQLYVCEASNLVMRATNLGEDARIDVLHGWQSGAHRATQLMWASPTDIKVVRGATARMKCIFSGNPLPATTWERVDSLFEESRTTSRHHELIIRNVAFSDSGEYRCTGYNEADSVPVAHTFTLLVEARPEWQSKPTDTTAELGESAEFECSAHGVPEPTVEWFINGQPIQETPHNPRRTLNGDTLHFSSLELSDSQVVQCNASNVHGYLWADAYLFVQETSASGDEVAAV